MAVDYDLVVIGASRAGIYAARQAALMQARVALVTQSLEPLLPDNTLASSSLGKVGLVHQMLAQTSLTKEAGTIAEVAQQMEWAEFIGSSTQDVASLNNLAALGVDVVIGQGQFDSESPLILQVAQRKFNSRNFLLATGANFVLDLANDWPQPEYLTLQTLSERGLSSLGSQIIVVGNNPLTLELAQALNYLGKQVTILVPQSRLLLGEDLDIVLMLQAQLEVAGIRIYTDVPVTQIKTIEEQKWVQAGDRVLTADEVLVTDYSRPNITGLNLAQVGVKYSTRKIYVNARLQTTNPRIYSCGALLGGYSLPNIAIYEANIILRNALMLPRHKVNYFSQPWAILTKPSLARVGLTEQQARQKYGDDIYVARKNFAELTQINQPLTGLCKLILQQDGTVLGCSLLGDGAVELIPSIALMMQRKLKLSDRPWQGLSSISIPTVYPSLAEILEYACQDFYQQKLQQNPRLLSRIKTWLNIRKNWF